MSYLGEIDFDSFVDVLSGQMSAEAGYGDFETWECNCVDSLPECLEPLLADAVSVSGVGCKAVVEEILSFELAVISVG